MQLPGHMAVSEAPQPSDILWHNLYISRTSKSARQTVVECLVALLTIVWIAPVTLISFVLSSESLRSSSPALDSWCRQYVVLASLVELIQPLSLLTIMNILPSLLALLATFEGVVSISGTQMSTFNRLYSTLLMTFSEYLCLCCCFLIDISISKSSMCSLSPPSLALC